MTEALEASLRAVLDAGAVVDLTRLSAGSSRETWSFEADGQGLILQRSRGTGSPASTTMTNEANLVRAAEAAGAPVPTVVAAGDGHDDGLDAPWMITERLDGETIPRKLLRDEEFAAVRPRLAAQCGEALARIHAIDPADVRLDETDQLPFWADIHHQIDDPHPTFELAFRWLGANQPQKARRTVVHGDFRNGNLLIDAERLQGVLDWELAHIGDPHEDLAWLCVRAWRFGEPMPVGGFGPRDQLLAAYESVSGFPVDRDALRWWEVFGCLRWAVICQIQVQSHLLGMQSLEQAAIGRRVAEAEYDVLLALPGGDRLTGTVTRPAEDGRVDRGLHDRPTAAELADALRHWITTEVADATNGRTHHLTRVAGNVLSMIERELALAPTLDLRHRARLDRFDAIDDAALAATIRDGHLADGDLLPALFDATLDKLSVANPQYVEERHR